MLLPGTRIRHSGYALRRQQQAIHSTGSPIIQQANRKRLREMEKERGVVLLPDAYYVPDPKVGVSVKWDNGRLSHLLSYLVEEDR